MNFTKKAQRYLETLCSVKPNRRTGSAGNRAATDFFAETIRPLGYEIDATPFPCLDYMRGESLLAFDGRTFEIEISPYSLACDVRAELVVVSTVEELNNTSCDGKILLMKGEICAEQLMPKNFVFYNPTHHQELIALLENKKPAAIITATAKNPDMVGALYPYPLFVDGDFDIPSVYCRDDVGEDVARLKGKVVHLQIEAQRLFSSATNVIARLNPQAAPKIVVTAHIDAYEDTPGASDNASGTVVLLLLAEMLADYDGEKCIEIAAFNGEDHYSAGGQMDYLRRYGDDLENISLAINIDDVGYQKGNAAYSFYEVDPQIKGKVEAVFQRFDGLVRGEPWYNGDHMIFVQNGVPCLAFTTDCIAELMRQVTHTALDTPDIVDCGKLVEVAEALREVVSTFPENS
ncbi:MAG: M28 family peptidase [Ardenticatenaceae bacterium]|nr:M28 family peptidase [Ardenticatenaceae bacterium]